MMKCSRDNKRVLYHADYQSVLEQNQKADLIIADPPYNLELADWDKDFDFEVMVNVISQIIKPTGSALIFNILPNVLEIYPFAEKYGLVVQDLMVWAKPNFQVKYLRKKGYVNKNREFILWLSASDTAFFQLKPNEKYHNGIFSYASPAGGFRFQKPKPLIDDLILRHSQPMNTVIDLFAGSGVVAQSCRQWKRIYQGYELDDDLFEKIDLH
ncbi:Modification methylase DpnIIB [Oceanobacillus oncorhynchi]|uniref:Modification methylase DpnIIB n=1 Tax=Oceanobacillus oncorhynchi TaxID=545501 RepID=A0A0A1MCD3_9BACI|nr:DNA methyltransferase [Oceanobacillus oncorhynchi]CEI80718.1 Modification methylase DpnIIB [Oceanobacillus oncorhynchi]